MKKMPTYATRGRPVTEPLTLLIRGRELLATGGTWCQGPMAKGLKRNGHPDKFCAIGALREAANVRWEYDENGSYLESNWPTPLVVSLAQRMLNEASDDMHGMLSHDFSDHHAKNVKEVVAVYDRAIENEKAAKRAARKAKASA